MLLIGVHLEVRPVHEKLLYLLVEVRVCVEGSKELVALDDGYREWTDSWVDLLPDGRSRGMTAAVRTRVTVDSDSGPRRGTRPRLPVSGAAWSSRQHARRTNRINQKRRSPKPTTTKGLDKISSNAAPIAPSSADTPTTNYGCSTNRRRPDGPGTSGYIAFEFVCGTPGRTMLKDNKSAQNAH